MKNILIVSFLVLMLLPCPAQVREMGIIPLSQERSRDYDAIHYRIELSVDPEKKSLQGQNTISLAPLRENLKIVKLDAQSLIATDVSDLEGKPLKFKQTEDNIFVDLGKVYNSTDKISFTVKYYLSEAVTGLKFIDEEGDQPLMVSSSCFPNKARQWIPCYDYPNDKATQEMIITTASKYKVLSNGRFMGKTDNQDGSSTWYWKQEKPHATYLINLSIADYLVVEDSLGNLPINYWVYHSMADRVERVFGKTPYMMEFFNKIYNYDFPWEKYDQVVSPYLTGGAEATSASIIGERVVTDEFSEQDYPREYVVAHELAHQWWGDLITCRSWEHTWLNESFGTYSDHLYTEYDLGDLEGDYDLHFKKSVYLDEFHNRFQRPIVYYDYEEPGDNFNRHTYQKGACTLHLLRYILGDDTFFRTISEFLHRHEFQSVSTFDFMKCVKEVSGLNMDWFFEQYFFRPGHPVFNVSKTWDENKKELTITIIQEQDKWKDVPIYRIPVRIGLFTGKEKDVREYWLENKTETLKIKLDSEPDLVRFDDGNILLKELTYKKSLKELVFQVNNDDMIGRMWAVGELSAYASDPVTIALWKNIAENDDFWAVRAAAVEQIGINHGEDNVDFLKVCAKDERSRVRAAAVKQLGNLKDAKLKGFYKDVFSKDNSYAAKSEALIAIGKCGKKSDIKYLEKAGLQKSYADVVANASQEAIEIITGNLK
jgi:aminopeptidase N